MAFRALLLAWLAIGVVPRSAFGDAAKPQDATYDIVKYGKECARLIAEAPPFDGRVIRNMVTILYTARRR